jgi:hypothetical protein
MDTQRHKISAVVGHRFLEVFAGEFQTQNESDLICGNLICEYQIRYENENKAQITGIGDRWMTETSLRNRNYVLINDYWQFLLNIDFITYPSILPIKCNKQPFLMLASRQNFTADKEIIDLSINQPYFYYRPMIMKLKVNQKEEKNIYRPLEQLVVFMVLNRRTDLFTNFFTDFTKFIYDESSEKQRNKG